MQNTLNGRLRGGLLLLLLLGASAGASLAAAPAEYPVKPVRFIVPYPPGGAPDLMARTLGTELTKLWGPQFIVDNRSGANGIVATEATARAAKDGYTLMMGSVATHAINPAVYGKVPFDPLKDFAPITQIGYTPLIIVAHPSVKASSVKELIAFAKANPGKLRYGTSGTGSLAHVAAELFKISASADLTHIPYKGIAMATTELLGGQIDLTVGNILNSIGHIKTGKLKAIGITGPTRSPAVPNVPTIAETLPGYEAILWWGVFAPAGVPKPTLDKLETEMVRVLNQPQLKDRWAAEGTVITPTSQEKLGAFLKAEHKRWAEVVKKAGVKAD
jgi:tripartite-type tricarboxylate transporter receptor subunit TctC